MDRAVFQHRVDGPLEAAFVVSGDTREYQQPPFRMRYNQMIPIFEGTF
jgi:hypothetical protein